MQSYIVLVLLSSFIHCTQSQNWLGTYTADSSCPPSLCCCVSGQVVVTTVSTNFVSFTTGLNGNGMNCAGATSYTTNMSTPTSYVTSLTISIITLTFTLSSNSLTINVTNSASSACQGMLTKNVTSINSRSTALNVISSLSQAQVWLLFLMVSIRLMKSVGSI